MMKKVFSLLTFMLLAVVMSSVAMAQSVEITEVEIDNDELQDSGTNFIFDVERGDELSVKVHIRGTANADDVQVEAALRGFDSSNTIDDITSTFDVKENVTYVKRLTLPLRQKLDQDTYLLRVRVDDRNSPTVEKTYRLEVDVQQHDVEIRDVVLSPSNEVKAGRALLATVRLRNRGERDEEGVKVTASIPELGVSAADFIDELEREDDDDDEATTEELFLRIPDNARTGEYTLRIEAEFDEGEDRNVVEQTIFVMGVDQDEGDDNGQDKTIIALAADSQAVEQGGSEVAYPITLTNAGSGAKTYTVSADGAAWADFRVSPTNVMVIDAGESKAVTVFVSASEDAPVGAQTFTVTVSSNDKVLKQLPLNVNVQEGDNGDSLRRGLEVALVALVILLVIIGLIVGFSRLRADDEDEDEKDEKTYY